MSRSRRPLDLIVSGAKPTYVGACLHSLGASVIPLSAETVTDMLRRSDSSAIATQAVVIDAEGYGLDDGQAVRRAIALAADIRALPSYVTQPTGARWKNVPIFIIVRDDGLALAVQQDPVHVVGLSALAGWRSLYQTIDTVVFDAEYAVLEAMIKLGVRFIEQHGRIIRVGPPNLKRRNGKRPELENELYDIRADVALHRRRARWWVRDVAIMYPEALSTDFRDAEEILARAHREQELQDLLERGGYWSEATAYELFRHPRIVAGDDINVERIPDIVVRRAADHRIELNELKTRQMKVISGGRYPAPTGALMRSGAQVTPYGTDIMAPENRARVGAIFGTSPRRQKISCRVIAGDTRGMSAEFLAGQRAQVKFQWSGVNEIIDRAVERLTR